MTQPSRNGRDAVAEKSGPVDETALRRTIQQPPPGQGPFYRDAEIGLFWLAQQADEIEPWGRNVKMRDSQLRAFVPVEPLFNSALGIICARNAAFAWTLEGPPRVVTQYQKVLQTANFGRGWADMLLRASIDLYTQDSGAFIEVIRERDTEKATVVGLASLDAARCYPTGHPEAPVVYMDRLGKYHYLKWYQVLHLVEMPAAYEGLPDLQYCALTRMLRAVRIIRDISIFLSEKVGGRNPRSITAVKGITPAQMTDAWNQAQALSDQAGFMRLMRPIIVGSTDPKADVAFATLDLASIPDGFNLETTNKWYISQIAMAFLEDYQTFAPLPGGGLGTSTQSEVLHMKARGKGPGLFMKIVSEALNWNVLPDSVEFQWDEQDADADQQEAATKYARANERSVRITSGEITPQVARDIAHEAGDLTQEQIDALAAQDLEKEALARENERQQEILEEGAPADAQNTPAGAGEQTTAAEGEQAPSPGQNDRERLRRTAGLEGQQKKSWDEVYEELKEWNEEDHPRDEGGKFSYSEGGSGVTENADLRTNENPYGERGSLAALLIERDAPKDAIPFIHDMQSLGKLSDNEMRVAAEAVATFQNTPEHDISEEEFAASKPYESVEKQFPDAVAKAEDSIRERYDRDGQEHATFIDKNGNQLAIIDGQQGSVAIDSWIAANQPLGMHTHPNDIGLSMDDANSSMNLNIGEIRAIGPNVTSIIRANRMRDDGKPLWDISAAARTYNAKMVIAQIKGSREYLKTGREPTEAEAKALNDRIWRATAKAANFHFENRPTRK